jgi:hypothetical protein
MSMGQFRHFEFAAVLAPPNVWKIAEESVLAAATAIAGVTPSLPTPLDRYIPDANSLRKYYDRLQDILAVRGFDVNLAAPQPIQFAKIDKSNFFDMVLAIDTRLHQSRGE